MSDIVDISVALLRKFAEFTKKLTPDQLAAVASGELRFGLLDGPLRKTPPSKPMVNIEQLAATLSTMTSRAAASDHIDGLGLTVPMLKETAKALGVSIIGVTKKDAIRDRIVEHTVGFRLNSNTIQDGSWSVGQP
jgi:hypothetical protein